MSAPGFDWPALMRAGIQGLGLTPSAFWALTPAELLMMLGDDPGAAPMGRDRLEALLARFPDRTGKETDDVRPE
jgi:uncharacterized phage protein (TIGR02216 family)